MTTEHKRQIDRALSALRAAQEIAQRDHHRAGGVWYDLGGLEMCVEQALDALEPDVKHDVFGLTRPMGAT